MISASQFREPQQRFGDFDPSRFKVWNRSCFKVGREFLNLFLGFEEIEKGADLSTFPFKAPLPPQPFWLGRVEVISLRELVNVSYEDVKELYRIFDLWIDRGFKERDFR